MNKHSFVVCGFECQLENYGQGFHMKPIRGTEAELSRFINSILLSKYKHPLPKIASEVYEKLGLGDYNNMYHMPVFPSRYALSVFADHLRSYGIACDYDIDTAERIELGLQVTSRRS